MRVLFKTEMMDEDGIEKLKQYDAIFLGAVGYPGVPDHVTVGPAPEHTQKF